VLHNCNRNYGDIHELGIDHLLSHFRLLTMLGAIIAGSSGRALAERSKTMAHLDSVSGSIAAVMSITRDAGRACCTKVAGAAGEGRGCAVRPDQRILTGSRKPAQLQSDGRFSSTRYRCSCSLRRLGGSGFFTTVCASGNMRARRRNFGFFGYPRPFHFSMDLTRVYGQHNPR